MLVTLVAAVVLTQPVPMAPAADQTVECRYQAVAETRIPARICMTRADWATLKARTEAHRARHRPVIDNRRPGRGIGRW
ncbi:MAG: hypothetical protein EON86_12550 [Brevundimonas sp.]|nr:MAG: hypothetical protein EON86_12550 [Brevundimonas sp.]